MSETETQCIEVDVEVEVNETKNEDGLFEDKYILSNRPDGKWRVHHIFDMDTAGFEGYFTSETVDPGAVPESVGETMSEYVGSPRVPLPSGDEGPAVLTEKARISPAGSEYRFGIFNGDIIRVTQDGARIPNDQVPEDIKTLVEEYIPSGADYMF